MKLIVNTSNLEIGGGVQVALSLIEELKAFPENHYVVFLSKAVKCQLDIGSFDSNFTFIAFESSPARLKGRKQLIAEFDRIERDTKPDVVFSVFGPAYWRPKSLHITGFALCWWINPESKAHRLLKLRKRFRNFLLYHYQRYYIKRDADFYIVETEDVKQRFSNIFNVCRDFISVVSNTYNSVFYSFSSGTICKLHSKHFRFITISANHTHKNLGILKKVVPLLRASGTKCHFYLTIPKEDFDLCFSELKDYVTNLGPVKIIECPQLYHEADALFLPTLLECFTASYPEAMQMMKPILTSDLGFAHTICGDAALYMDPLDPVDVAEKIQILIHDKQLRGTLVSNGRERLNLFPNARQRAQAYLEICEHVTQRLSRGPKQ